MVAHANVRNMLRTYGRQLTNAKRLARFRQALGPSVSPEEQTLSRQAKRRELVNKIAREIIENLIVNSTQTPIVAEILDDLERDTGVRYHFEYPLDGNDVQILRAESGRPTEVTGVERDKVMRRLWETTVTRVDNSML